MTKHLFILNPAAGKKDRTEEIISIIEALGLTEPYEIFKTDAPHAAEDKIISAILSNPDDFIRIYACGGDGTLSEAANGIYRSGGKNCALGVVPAGSGNDFAKALTLPADLATNIKALTVGEIDNIDLLRASDDSGRERISLNIISAGFDAEVAKGQEKFKKLPLVNGSLAYVLSLIKTLFSSLKHYFKVEIDGKVFDPDGKNGPYLLTIAANGIYYGGGFKASPYSDLADGLLDFIRIDTVPRLKFIMIVKKFRAGKYIHEYSDIVAFKKAKSMKLISENVIGLNLDGEIFDMINPKIEILPKALGLIIPSLEN